MVGHYVSVRHELLYICTRGNCTRDTPKLLPSVVRIPKSGVHSQKPENFYEIIEEMYTYGRKLELFARGRRREGWDAVGNELEEDACPGFEQLSPSPSLPILNAPPTAVGATAEDDLNTTLDEQRDVPHLSYHFRPVIAPAQQRRSEP